MREAARAADLVPGVEQVVEPVREVAQEADWVPEVEPVVDSVQGAQRVEHRLAQHWAQVLVNVHRKRQYLLALKRKQTSKKDDEDLT